MSLNPPLAASVDHRAKIQKELDLWICPKYISWVKVELFQDYNFDIHVPHFTEWPTILNWFCWSCVRLCLICTHLHCREELSSLCFVDSNNPDIVVPYPEQVTAELNASCYIFWYSLMMFIIGNLARNCQGTLILCRLLKMGSLSVNHIPNLYLIYGILGSVFNGVYFITACVKSHRKTKRDFSQRLWKKSDVNVIKF